MLYSHSHTEKLAPELFECPTKEYRAAPFWAWNCKLDQEQIRRQVPFFQEMGMGGFHIHSRVGLDTPYLGKAFFEDVHAANEEAKKNDLLTWLYDEDRWPSGTCGGEVTKNKDYRMRFLVLEPADYQETGEKHFMSAAEAIRSGDKRYLASFRIGLDQNGHLASYQKVARGCQADHIWNAYVEVSGETPWFNNQAYVDTLNPKAMERFISLTHEKYYQELKDDFGTQIPAIFTDEPQILHKSIMESPWDTQPLIMPYTDDFNRTFLASYGYDIEEKLPEIFWECDGDQGKKVRYDFHRHLCERFSQAFGDTIGAWCEAHQLKLTGHMMSEWTLYSQTLAVGETMRPMRGFGIPGVDMLCDAREYSTVKQAASVAHQFGREGVMSELYGVTGWTFDFRNHKLAGDWQAALGVTLRVPHLSWLSMEGEGKRDYPASINYQSPWYREYSCVENHFARLNTALTRGTPHIKVAVIHPIESYWMNWGNRLQTSVKRQSLEENFTHIIEWLLFDLIDFDFISESVLSEETGTCQAESFPMGKMSYEVVIVPECNTIRTTTLKRLQAFRRCGGRVIFMGDAPEYLDAVKSETGKAFAATCEQIRFSKPALLGAVEACREIDIQTAAAEGIDKTRVKHVEEGSRSDNLFYQMRDDGADRWLFVCHVNRPKNESVTNVEKWTMEIRGAWKPVLYDTMTGKITPLAARIRDGRTVIVAYASAQDSLLLKLEPTQQTGAVDGVQPLPQLPAAEKLLPEPVATVLSEENTELLDLAEYAFDDGDWMPEEEILRIDNAFREKLGYPLRMEALAQPYTETEEEKAVHLLRLRFTIEAQVPADQVTLAMEHIEDAELFWNRQKVKTPVSGWFTDECIRKKVLGKLQKGTNLLEIRIPFRKKTNVEWCYLLGSFGVTVCGRKKKIVDAPAVVQYGDYTQQALPFYAGNLSYLIEENFEAGELHLEIPDYRGALIKVWLDDRLVGPLFLAPYRINCGPVSAGRHRIRLELFGNRANAFGPVHHTDETERWYGPNLWRTAGKLWSYEYRLVRMGILTAPMYWIVKENKEETRK